MLLTRRTLVGAVGVASAIVLGGAAPSDMSVSPSSALQRLADGNRRYVRGQLDPRDFTVGRAARAVGQAPFAAILACSDSRVAPELIFDCHPGAIFVVRNAGNCVEPFGLASLEYAVTALGVRLILLMGHSGCGAVKAAIATVEEGSGAPGHLPALINDVRPSIETVRSKGEKQPTLDAVVRAHVVRGVAEIQANQPTLAPMVQTSHLSVVGGMYDIASGRVSLI